MRREAKREVAILNPGEAAKLLAVLDQLYPNAKKATSPVAQAKSWALVLRDWSYRQMEAALVAFAANDAKGFPPSPGQLIDVANNLADRGEDMTEQEAWVLVQRALSNGMYGYRDEWDKLPGLVQACVGSPNQLREWATTDASAVNTVVASNFMRSFRAKKTAHERYEKTPGYIREAAAKLFAPPDAQRALSEPEEQERKRKLLEQLNTAKKG